MKLVMWQTIKLILYCYILKVLNNKKTDANIILCNTKFVLFQIVQHVYVWSIKI